MKDDVLDSVVRQNLKSGDGVDVRHGELWQAMRDVVATDLPYVRMVAGSSEGL